MDNEMSIFDVKDYIWRLLSGWKLMAIYVVTISIIISAIFYLRDLKQYNNELASYNAASDHNTSITEEQKEEMLSSLPDSDRKKIEAVLEADNTVKETRDYLANSIKMNVDPYNMQLLEVSYLIEASGSDITRSIVSLLDAYNNYVSKGPFVKAVKNALGLELQSNYIAELIETERSVVDGDANNGAIIVRVILPDDADIDKVEKAVKREMSIANKKLNSTVVPHNATALWSNRTRKSDTVLAQTKINFENTVVNMTNTEANILASLGSDAMSVYNRLKVTENGADEEAEAEVPVPAPVKPSISKKKCLVAIVLSGLLYMFLYAAYMLYKRCVYSADSASSDMEKKCIGEAYYKTEEAGIKKLLKSDKVMKMRFGKKFNDDTQSEDIARGITNRLTHDGIKETSLLVIGNSDKKRITDSIDGVIGALKKNKITADRVDFSRAVNGNDDTAFAGLKNAVPVIIGGSTLNSEISASRDLISDYDIEIPGIVYLEEF